MKRNAKRTSRPTGASRRRSPASRRSAPPTAAAPLAALAGLAAVARRLGTPWYVFGATAVAHYGVVRTTADVDVTILATAVTASEVVAALRAEGFMPTFDDPRFAAETRVVPAVHEASGTPVDLVLGGWGLEEEIARAARPMRAGRLRVPVISPEHLIAVKLLARRPKDLEDVRGLLRQPSLALDEPLLHAIVAQLEEALGQADLRPLLDELGRAPRPASRREPRRTRR